MAREAYIRELMAQADGEIRPIIHPNGFIQVQIDDHRRLHFWHPSFPRQEVRTPVHNHVFDFSSKILAGQVTHVQFDVSIQGIRDATHKVYQAVPAGANRNTSLLPNGQTVAIREKPAVVCTEGQQYEFRAFEFHESRDEEPGISLMTKLKSFVGSPCILVPIGEEPDNDFKRDDIETDQLEALIEQVIKVTC